MIVRSFALAVALGAILFAQPVEACRVAPRSYEAGEIYPVILALEALETAELEADAWAAPFRVTRVIVGEYGGETLRIEWPTWPGKCEYFEARPQRGGAYVVMLQPDTRGDLYPHRLLELEEAVRRNPALAQ